MILCKNHDDLGAPPGCRVIADGRYTMDFDDVEPGAKLHWCSFCGPSAHAMEKAITEAIETRPGFADRLREAIDGAEEGKETTQ